MNITTNALFCKTVLSLAFVTSVAACASTPAPTPKPAAQKPAAQKRFYTQQELRKMLPSVPKKELTDLVLAAVSCMDTQKLIAKKPNAFMWSDALNDYFKAHPAENAYAGMFIKSLKNNKLCLKNIRFVVAFDTIVASGEVCNQDTKDYINHITDMGYPLKPVNASNTELTKRQVTHFYTDSKTVFSVFNGIYDLRQQKIINPEGMSYQCVTK